MYDDGCHLDFEREEVQQCRYGASDGLTTIALFGDSHAAQWFPALMELAARDPWISIDTYTKSSCPAVSTTVLQSNVPYLSCDRWREAVLHALVTNPPEIVVVSDYSGYALAEVAYSSARIDRWAAGTRDTVQRLREAGSDVIVIADTPRLDTAPAACASAHSLDVAECANARSKALDPRLSAAERIGVEEAGGMYIDLNDFICDSDSCPVVIDDLFVYRDVNHLTTTFVKYLAPAITQYVKPLVDRRRG